MARSLTALLLLLLVATFAAGCGDSDSDHGSKASPKAGTSSSKAGKSSHESAATNERVARFRASMEAACAKRFTNPASDCRRDSKCMIDHMSEEGDLGDILEQLDRDDPGDALDTMLEINERCIEEVGLEADPGHEDSPEFIKKHEDEYRAKEIELIRDEVCVPGGGHSRSECDDLSTCVVEDLGVVRVYEIILNKAGETVTPEFDDSYAACEAKLD